MLLLLLLLLSLLLPPLLLLLLRAAGCVSARVEGAPELGQESGHSRFHTARSPASITTSLAGLGPALQQMRRHDARTLPYLSAAGGCRGGLQGRGRISRPDKTGRRLSLDSRLNDEQPHHRIHMRVMVLIQRFVDLARKQQRVKSHKSLFLDTGHVARMSIKPPSPWRAWGSSRAIGQSSVGEA